MARIRFTANIQRHVACPPEVVEGKTLREALDDYFERHPRARGYVLDDQGAVRHHMNVFVNGRAIVDREGQSDALPDAAEIDVIQALSGG
jgi:sulfur-carrier protein